MDTVALVMWWTDATRLGDQARIAIEDRRNDLYLSPVSVWEIANKNRIGKLDEMEDFQGQYPDLLADSGFRVLALSDGHAMTAGYLPGVHRDPFDRLLAGQALSEGLTVLTNDRQLAAFGCAVLW